MTEIEDFMTTLVCFRGWWLAVNITIGALAVTPALASDKTDVLDVIHQWGSKGAKDAVLMCADEAFILADIPPYEWHGLGACSKWLNDFEAFADQNGIEGGYAVVGKARHLDIAGDHAYVVAPITYHYKNGGKEIQEQATGTFALQKGVGGWRIAAWTYSPK